MSLPAVLLAEVPELGYTQHAFSRGARQSEQGRWIGTEAVDGCEAANEEEECDEEERIGQKRVDA